MTLQELRTIVADIQDKEMALMDSVQKLGGLLATVSHIINGPFSSTINVDALVALETPLYIEALTAIETAADALGTDPFH